jgi:hypothetical protein
MVEFDIIRETPVCGDPSGSEVFTEKVIPSDAVEASANPQNSVGSISPSSIAKRPLTSTHFPQVSVLSATTRSPTFKLVTLLPTLATDPTTFATRNALEVKKLHAEG